MWNIGSGSQKRSSGTKRNRVRPASIDGAHERLVAERARPWASPSCPTCRSSAPGRAAPDAGAAVDLASAVDARAGRGELRGRRAKPGGDDPPSTTDAAQLGRLARAQVARVVGVGQAGQRLVQQGDEVDVVGHDVTGDDARGGRRRSITWPSSRALKRTLIGTTTAPSSAAANMHLDPCDAVGHEQADVVAAAARRARAASGRRRRRGRGARRTCAARRRRRRPRCRASAPRCARAGRRT